MGDLMGYYDKAGREITQEQWGRLRFGSDNKVSDYARIGLDQVGGAEVSTVWLGMNHAFAVGAPPLIFETMVFGGEHGDEINRYSTEGQALIGHRRAVNNLRRGRAPW